MTTPFYEMKFGQHLMNTTSHEALSRAQSEMWKLREARDAQFKAERAEIERRGIRVGDATAVMVDQPDYNTGLARLLPPSQTPHDHKTEEA